MPGVDVLFFHISKKFFHLENDRRMQQKNTLKICFSFYFSPLLISIGAVGKKTHTKETLVLEGSNFPTLHQHNISHLYNQSSAPPKMACWAIE